MSGWRLEKKSQTAYRFKKKEGRAFVALLSSPFCKKRVCLLTKLLVIPDARWQIAQKQNRKYSAK